MVPVIPGNRQVFRWRVKKACCQRRQTLTQTGNLHRRYVQGGEFGQPIVNDGSGAARLGLEDIFHAVCLFAANRYKRLALRDRTGIKTQPFNNHPRRGIAPTLQKCL